ncbi:uncharacterized protein LOC144701320 [Wolffia australiana]
MGDHRIGTDTGDVRPPRAARTDVRDPEFKYPNSSLLPCLTPASLPKEYCHLIGLRSSSLGDLVLVLVRSPTAFIKRNPITFRRFPASKGDHRPSTPPRILGACLRRLPGRDRAEPAGSVPSHGSFLRRFFLGSRRTPSHIPDDPAIPTRSTRSAASPRCPLSSLERGRDSTSSCRLELSVCPPHSLVRRHSPTDALCPLNEGACLYTFLRLLPPPLRRLPGASPRRAALLATLCQAGITTVPAAGSLPGSR